MPPTTRNNRRQTLGAVNDNATNRRKESVGGAGIPPPTKTPKGNRRTRKSRVSMIPRITGRENDENPLSPAGIAAPTQASRRKASLRGGDRRKTLGHDAFTPSKLAPTSSVVRTDTRPIHDKAFQQECIKKLLNFLLQNGYEYPLSQKSLSRPSGRDFTQMVTFLLRQVDPCFQESGGGKDAIVMKLEDEIAMNFKVLGYPFPISKTALVAAGSPHTWPTLLAALAWLIDMLEILQEDVIEEVPIVEAKPFETLDELEIETDKAFFSYLGQSYAAFLEGDENLQAQLEQALCDRFEQDDAYIEQEIERVTDLNAAMVEGMNKMVQESEK